MRGLYRWFVEQFREIDRAMEEMRDFSHVPGGEQRSRFATWAPATEVFGECGDLVIRVELPGLGPEEVDLTLEDGVLIVSGERKVEPEVSEARHYYLCEPAYGPFRRIVTLSEASRGCAGSRVEFESGVVEVVVEGAADGAAKVTLEPAVPTR